MSDNSTSAGYWKEIALLAAIMVAGVIGYSWLKAHDAWMRFQVESQLKDQQITLRDKQAAADRQAIEQLKKQTETPRQIVREIPKIITLPLPPEESGVGSQESVTLPDSRLLTPDS